MKRVIYLVRKSLGFVLLALCFAFFLIIIFKGINKYKAYIPVLFIILLLIIIFIFSIYPYRSDYCKCGRKYDKKKAEYLGEKKQQKIDNDVIITFYKHYVEIECYCKNCKRKYFFKESLYGGIKKDNIKTQEIINRRISYDEAIRKYLSN